MAGIDWARIDWSFEMMRAMFAVRDLVRPPEWHLHEAGLRPGDVVLDYGCGPGSFSVAAADVVLPTGMVYALDRNPAALTSVKKRARKKGFEQHIRTIQSPGVTGLPDASVDVVLLYDVLHMLDDAPTVLAEIHRVLKPSGLLSVAIHHMPDKTGIDLITGTGRFSVTRVLERTVGFTKASR